LLDYKLTDISGRIIADKLKKMDESVQIIYITGYSLKNGEMPTNEAVREILVKPIPEHLLLRIVSEAVADQGVQTDYDG
ncbi:response regulator, partial [Candidatus Bathyarchaeota archaeon]|nr:response regulator [Candidatus Bathyarchaeota archaeon]